GWKRRQRPDLRLRHCRSRRLGYDDLSVLEAGSALLLRLLLGRCCSVRIVALSRYGGVAQLVERLTGSQEVRGFESHRLHSKSQVRAVLVWEIPSPDSLCSTGCSNGDESGRM